MLDDRLVDTEVQRSRRGRSSEGAMTDTDVLTLERVVRAAIREKYPDAMAQHVRYVAGKASDLIRKNMHHLGYRAIIKSGARNTRDNETTKPAA